MGDSWYLRRSGKLIGPLPFEDLRALAGSGELTPDDDVRSGHGYWQAARTVDELWTDLTLRIAEDVAVDSSVSAGIGGIPWNEAATTLRDPLPSRESEQIEHRYLCRGAADSNEIGPYSLAAIQELVAEGRLAANDRVRAEGSLCWIPCRELTGVEFSAVETSAAGSSSVSPQSGEVEISHSTLLDGPAATGNQESLGSATTGDSDEFDPMDVLSEETVEPVPPHDSATGITDESPDPDESGAGGASTDEPELPTQTETASRAIKPSSKKSSKRAPGRVVRPRFGLNGSWLVYVLAGSIVVFAVIKLMAPRGGIYGEVLIDDTPLPLGSMTITPDGLNPREGMSIGVVDGRFESADQQTLPPGSYDVRVTIGNHLGNTVPRLDKAPALAALNGATLTTRIEFQPGDPILVSLNSSAAHRLESGSGSVLTVE